MDSDKQKNKIFKKEFERLSEINIEQQPHFDLDKEIPHQEGPPSKTQRDSFKVRHDAKREFQVDGADFVFSTFKIEFNSDNFGFEDYGFRTDFKDLDFWLRLELQGGKYTITSVMDDDWASHLLQSLPEIDNFLLRIKFLRENEGGWFVEDKYDPIRLEREKGSKHIEISRETKAGVLKGIDKVYYNNAYPVSAVIYDLYKLSEPDINKLPTMKEGGRYCVAQRIIDYYENSLRGKGLTDKRREQNLKWEQQVHESGASIYNV